MRDQDLNSGASADSYWSLMNAQSGAGGQAGASSGQGAPTSSDVPLAVTAIGQSGLNHVVYPDGDSGIHDDDGNPVPSHVVRAVLQGPSTVQLASAHHRRRRSVSPLLPPGAPTRPIGPPGSAVPKGTPMPSSDAGPLPVRPMPVAPGPNVWHIVPPQGSPAPVIPPRFLKPGRR